MARRSKHTLLWVAGVGVAAWAAYEWVYKPWRAARKGAQTDIGVPWASPYLPAAGAGSTALPGPSSVIAAPESLGNIVSYNTLGPHYDGPLGACIAKKGGTWTPEYCQARLTALIDSARTSKAQIAALKAAANPNAGAVPAAQAQLALVQAALAGATANYNAAVQRQDDADAAKWHVAVIDHQNEAAELAARIGAASQAPNNVVAIAAYEAQLAANDRNYYELTGQHLLTAA